MWTNVTFVYSKETYITGNYLKRPQCISKLLNKRPNFMSSPVDGRTKLFFIEGNMDANYYQDILYKTIVRHGYHTYRTLLQDWASPHKANSTKKFLRDNNFNLVEDYPASSPDINPIEKVWGWMKHRIQEKFPENKKQLKQAIKDTYFELRQEIIHGFIGGIESVCMKIEESEGGNIFQ